MVGNIGMCYEEKQEREKDGGREKEWERGGRREREGKVGGWNNSFTGT